MTNSFGYTYAAGGFTERWGHHAPLLLNLSIMASILLGLRSSAPTLLSLVASVSLLGFVVLTWLMMRQHDRRLCETCARSIPLNAAEQASRYRRRFATAHAGSNLKLVGLYLAVLLASNALLTVPYGRWVWAAVQTSMMYLITAYATHRRLQPWCPWCSGGGTDDTDVTPDVPRDRGRQLV